LTGRYPAWWEGRRFDHAIDAWAAGDTAATVREIIQEKLVGRLVRKPGDPIEAAFGLGTGMIPGDLIHSVRYRSGIPDAIETISVHHVSGGISLLTLKSYEQGRESFQGTRRHLIWLDEEPPREIYTECLMRTMTCEGIVILTFTPLKGMSEVVQTFLQARVDTPGTHMSKYVGHCSWEEVPHLSDKAKAELLDAIPPYERDARSRGIPSLGRGAIYPVPESDIIVPDFEIPSHWPRAYGLDIGWNWTAAVWGAHDRESDRIYLYKELKVSQQEPWEIVRAIRSNGDWIPGVIDPSAQGRKIDDGRQMIEIYRNYGLNIDPAKNAVDAGLQAVWDRLSTGRLKVFQSLRAFLEEYRLYRRDDKGNIVKENDHLMDATRYLIVSGRDRMITEPDKRRSGFRYGYDGCWGNGGPQGWMAN
jgi:phage terminase large subunit-like protein